MKRALAIIEKVLEYNSDDEYYLSTAAIITSNLGKYNEAKKYFTQVLDIDPNLIDILSEKKLITFENVMNNNTK